ncbi:MAG: hypothetical protein ACI4NG_04445 [Candidatus Gallimonas sp.]
MRCSEEKAKRIIAGATAAGVVLLVFLLAVMIYQFVRIGVMNSRKKALQEEIATLQRQIDEEEESLEYYSSEFYQMQLARQYGCTVPKGD